MKKELILSNNVSEIDKLAKFIEEVGEECQLSPELVFQLNLVMEEAVSNIILYAFPANEKHTVSLSVAKDGERLIFILSDSGKEFDPTQVEDADVSLSAEEREIGGLGIFLVRQIMDTVEYQRIDGKNILTLKKQL